MNLDALLAKAIFLWNIPAVEGGDPDAIADLLVQAKIETVMAKAANSVYKFVPSPGAFPGWGENIRPEFVQTMHRRGIQVVGWGFNYGLNTVGEATVAIAQVKQFDLDGWVTDGEGVFDAHPNAVTNARLLTGTIKRALPSLPLGVCGWAFYFNPRKLTVPWHPKAVLHAQMEHADVGIPMQYYDGRGAEVARAYVQSSLAQWKQITNKPIVPACRAYNGDNGYTDPAGIQSQAGEALKLGSAGYTAWSLEHLVKLPDVWSAFAALRPMRAQVEPVALPVWAGHVDDWARSQGYAGPRLVRG